jgi:hypothetical protein
MKTFVTGFVTPEAKSGVARSELPFPKTAVSFFSEDGNGTIWCVSYGR